MHCKDCSALHGTNLNLQKWKRTRNILYEERYQKNIRCRKVNILLRENNEWIIWHKQNQKYWSTSALNRSRHWRCFVKKGVLRYFAKFIGKHLCLSLFFNKVADLSVFHEFCEISKNTVFFRTPLGDCFCLKLKGFTK